LRKWYFDAIKIDEENLYRYNAFGNKIS